MGLLRRGCFLSGKLCHDLGSEAYYVLYGHSEGDTAAGGVKSYGFIEGMKNFVFDGGFDLEIFILCVDFCPFL